MHVTRRFTMLAGTLVLALPAPGHAVTASTGYNDGSKGTIHFVYGVNVPAGARSVPRTFGLAGDCEYVPGSDVQTDRVPIVVEAQAAAAPSWDAAAAISTTVLCEVVGPTGTVLATAATAGGATAAVGLGQVTLEDLGQLEICITLTARFTDTSTAVSDRPCLPPDGIVASVA
jgi:hypothetical protein